MVWMPAVATDVSFGTGDNPGFRKKRSLPQFEKNPRALDSRLHPGADRITARGAQTQLMCGPSQVFLELLVDDEEVQS
jgi:hypothetical protein